MSLPQKVAQIREKLGLAPDGGSIVASVREASKSAGLTNEGGPLLAQVDRLMAQLFAGGA